MVVSGGRRAVFGLGAAAGIAGPAAFTGAWIASSLRQTRHGPGGLQLSGLLYASLVAAQAALAGRFGRDPGWRRWRPPLLASAAVTGVLLLAYATDVTGPAAAILQRAAVTVPQAAVAAIAARLLWRGPGQEGSGG